MPYYMPTLYWDWTMLILIPGIILGLIAQSSVKNAYARYSRVFSRSGITGAQAARRILEANGIYDVRIERAAGTLSDHYDPKSRVLRLSDGVYNSSSIAALGIAAHEVGHACQHHSAYTPLNIRNALVPIVSFGSNAAFPLILLGLFVGSQTLLNIAIFAYGLAVLFQLITLPVEFNASHRAMASLSACGLLVQDEEHGAKKVLRAAAMTYIAAALSSILQLVRLFLLYGNRRRND